ncbi:glutaredoxin domain-containing protein [Nocardia thailandica]
MAAEQGSWEAITTALDRKVGPGRPAGTWTRYCCPVHEDGSGHKPSLGVKYDARSQRTVVKCFAGCPDDQVLAAIGLKVRDMFDRKAERTKERTGQQPEPRPPSRAERALAAAGLPPLRRKGAKTDRLGAQLTPWRTTEEYPYHHADGTVAGVVSRKQAQFENGTDKSFVQRRWTGTGWEFTAFDKIPYRLPQVLAAIAAGQPIYLTEGEKDANNGAEADPFGAHTTNAGGAAAWTTEHSRWLRGAVLVVIVADRDAAGYHRAERIMDDLLAQGVRQVRVVQARTGKDLTDHLRAGYSHADLAAVPILDPHTPFAVSQSGEPTMSAPTTEAIDSITLYTKSDCVQCGAAKNLLDRLGVTYRIVDLERDDTARTRFRDMGLLTAPVLEAGTVRVAGFRPDRIKELVASIRPEPPPAPAEPPHSELSESVDLDAVRRWAAPYLHSAQRRGDIPSVGSPAWVALPNGDPRKTGAIVQAALEQAAASAPATAPAPSSAPVAQHNAVRAAAAPLTPPARTVAPRSPASAAPAASAALVPPRAVRTR